MKEEKIREILYKFIEFYTKDELEQLDLRFVVDKFIEEDIND